MSLLFVLLATNTICTAQEMNVRELTSLLYIPDSKIEAALKRKGWQLNGEEYSNDSLFRIYRPQKQSGTQLNTLSFYKDGQDKVIRLTTNVRQTAVSIQSDLTAQGFFQPDEPDNGFGQKEDLTVCYTMAGSDSAALFSFRVERKRLPSPKEIAYAEDLLQLDSHEYLCTVFGKGNVHQDRFFIAANKTIPCTVIFPNTPREAVFLWEDQQHMRALAALRIGGDPQTKGSREYGWSVAQNAWQSREGLYIGMGLTEIRRMSAQHQSNSQPAFDEALKKETTAPAASIGLELSCLNCGDNRYFTATFATASNAEEEGRKIFLSTMILFRK